MKNLLGIFFAISLIVFPACGSSSSGNSVSVPSAPTNVKSTPGVGTSTTSWDPVEGTISYNMYMSTMSGVQPVMTGSSMIGGTMKYENVTSPYAHEAGSLMSGATYYCAITALNSAGESEASEEVSSTIL